MKGSVWVLTIAVFVVAIAVFSRGYASLMAFFALPTTAGLLSVMFHLALFLLVMSVLAFIMYASERRNGNVKVKNALFERLIALFERPSETSPRGGKS